MLVVSLQKLLSSTISFLHQMAFLNDIILVCIFRANSFLTNFYRPQTKFAKVMCLQVSVCPRGGVHGCSQGGHAWLLLGGCVVALGGHAWLLWGGVWLLLGGHVWLLLGGHAWLLWGGVHGCSGGYVFTGVCLSTGGGMCGCSQGGVYGVYGCSWGGLHGCSGGGGMHGCSGGCVVALGVCMVAPGGTCMVALGGHVWLLRGGTCMVALGGHAWLLPGGHA